MGTLVFGGGDPVNCMDPTGLKTARWESRGFNEWSRNLCGRLGITKLIWDLDTEEIAKISSLESQIADFRQQMPSARGQQADELECAIGKAEGYIQAIHEWDPNLAGPREGQTFTFPFAKYEKDPKNFFFLRDFGRAFSAGFHTGLATGVAMQETEVVAAKRTPKPTPNLNRLNHVFGKAEHALDDLVVANGSQEAAFQAVQRAANEALAAGKLTPNANGILPLGDAGNIIQVGNLNVRLIGGRVNNGVVQISSFSRKGL
jgi:hypothetical protein